jgi:hypothetical protein
VEPASVQFPLFAAVPFAAGVICTSLAFAILSRDPGDYGEIAVEAKTEAGACFALTLPLSDGPDPDA